MNVAGPTQNEPYCGHCGYVLTGATESSKCPECGRPLVDVLMRPVLEAPGGGKRFRSKARLVGLPILDIAIGPHGRERRGHARGFIAIGDVATGVLAMGGQARGVVAVGGVALGGFTMGGLSVGLVSAVGGMSIGGMALGGLAAGALARGGFAAGLVADGGVAIGYYARGGRAFGPQTLEPGGASSPRAIDVFDSLAWFFGPWPPTVWTFATTFISTLVLTLVLAGACALVAVWAYARSGRGDKAP